jgi:ribonuclease J
VDHSAYDAHAFLVEVGGRRVFYSGDFREGGWKTGTLETIASLCHEPVNVLMLEGTTLGSDAHEGCATEAEVAKVMTSSFREFVGKPILVYASGQNIDRICSLVKAANAPKRTPIFDLYQGTVLHELAQHNPKLPHPMSREKAGMGVWFTEKTWKSWRSHHPGSRVAQPLIDARIYDNEVPGILPFAVLMVRPSMLQDLEKLPGLRDGLFIYSLWEGYKESEDTKRFLDFLAGRGFTERVLHTSGHAGEETLRKLVGILQPQILMPIHTLHPERYEDLFKVPVNASGCQVFS